MTQQQFADLLQIKRSLVGSYEEERAMPKIAVLQRIAANFEFSIDDLINTELSLKYSGEYSQSSGLKVLPIVVDADNREQISIVPLSASAGYLNGFSDPEYIGELPTFNIPVKELQAEKSYRVFQIKGDSMLPVTSGSYIICEYISEISAIKEGQAYVLITLDEGLLYKRLFKKENGKFLLKSDNIEFSPYEVEQSSVLEIWKALGILSFDLPNSDTVGIRELMQMISELKDEIRGLKEK